jgi:PASTA domain-containing protein
MRRPVVLIPLVCVLVGCGKTNLVRSQPTTWSLVQVGPRERSLEASVSWGACESKPVLRVRESARTVAVDAVIEHPRNPREMCILIALEARPTVRLKRPLAGRSILGASKTAPYSLPKTPMRDGSSYAEMPRLLGLAPADAKRLLHDLRLPVETHSVGETSGLPRVVAQSPPVGSRIRRDARFVLSVG